MLPSVSEEERMDPADHNRRIVDQFSRQAVPFGQVTAHSDADALDLMIRMSEAVLTDEVLDAGCGPGLVARAFAPKVRSIVGTDLTPAMLEQAQKRAAEAGLANATFAPGDMERQPFADGSFSLVLTRYTFHHLLRPDRALAEMVRVCRPGGRVMVVDAAVPAEKAAAYDQVELIRDPSHVHVLTPEGLVGLVEASGLRDVQVASYRLDIGLDTALAASFPDPGGAEKLRALFEADLGADRIGVQARRVDGKIRYAVPCTVVVGRKR
jgi:SAM-dependent methyltransferase